jgi:hypothetical protein
MGQGWQTGTRRALTLAFTVSDIGPEREQEEETTQYILALGDPRDGFHPQGMQGKQGRHGGTSPERPGHAPQEEEDQETIEDVQEQVHPVGASGTGTKEAQIEHKGQPGDRMPVAEVNSLEGPLDAVPLQALENVRVVIEISGVVEVNEVKAGDRPKESKGHGGQQAGDGSGQHTLGKRRVRAGGVTRLTVSRAGRVGFANGNWLFQQAAEGLMLCEAGKRCAWIALMVTTGWWGTRGESSGNGCQKLSGQERKEGADQADLTRTL